MARLPLEDIYAGSDEDSELVFGLSAAVGSPIDFVVNALEKGLRNRGYEVETVRISSFTDAIKLSAAAPKAGAREYDRVRILMERGNELRKSAGRGDVLALFVAAHINSQRQNDPPRALSRKAFILRQIKHPEEVYALRGIYGDGFHQIGIYCPKSARQQYLMQHKLMEEWEAQKLIQRDENEPPEWGQKFRDSFCLSDFFLGIENIDRLDSIERDLARFLDLLFGVRVISPRKDEYGMYLAQAAALRSAQLSRQVGAAILSEFGDVLALGTNEVPSAGGGQYWEDGDRPDSRDHRRGRDSTDQMEREILQEILENVDPTWDDLAPSRKEAAINDLGGKLKNARVMNLTEFGRAVHAEMEAITSAARIGVSVRRATLYTTTFPCHGCAKHVIGAGIDRVVYIEPYPKSLARDLHADAICLDGDEEDRKVRFEPFLGVAPRRYAELFSLMTKEGRRLRRKDREGRLLVSDPALRLSMKPSSYIQRESVAAK